MRQCEGHRRGCRRCEELHRLLEGIARSCRRRELLPHLLLFLLDLLLFLLVPPLVSVDRIHRRPC